MDDDAKPKRTLRPVPPKRGLDKPVHIGAMRGLVEGEVRTLDGVMAAEGFKSVVPRALHISRTAGMVLEVELAIDNEPALVEERRVEGNPNLEWAIVGDTNPDSKPCGVPVSITVKVLGGKGDVDVCMAGDFS